MRLLSNREEKHCKRARMDGRALSPQSLEYLSVINTRGGASGAA